ncbi:MAG TPA: multicopper oxidase domain-containing protein, partial [Candidatus Limnocylindrales bacterium]|nr:multicopper oxidase domain-containing protein [Candidatus Limnocylindrales bacterium]
MGETKMTRTRLGLALAAVALVVGACAPAAAAPKWTFSPADAQPAGQPAATAPSSGGDVLGVIDVKAADLSFDPTAITVAKAGAYQVQLTNAGAIQHNITFADGATATADPGKTASVVVNVPAAGLMFSCSVPGHAAAGMEGMITVSDTAAATTSPASGGASTGSATPSADPNAPAYVLRDATAPPVMSGTVHDVDFPIIEKDITVAKGFVVHAWTFGGTVPGPTLRVHLGDTVRVHLTNQTQMSHSIDFHASQTAMNDQMVEIKPGATFTYTFTADYAGVWMYHCGTAPALEHIANGMFGMVIVEPKGGLPKVDNEFAFVQSEWYLGGQGQIADYTKASSGAPAPDLVVFNGVANQYKDNPVMVTTKGRVRVFVLDAGPNIDSSFHVVGTIFDQVIKEGIELSRGNAGGWGSQAVDLSPAQGAIIEFSPLEDGMYPFVTHAFNFVTRGAIGVFMAGDGNPKN